MENRLIDISESPYSELNKADVQDQLYQSSCAILRAVTFANSRNVISKRVAARYWLVSVEGIKDFNQAELNTFREYTDAN